MRYLKAISMTITISLCAVFLAGCPKLEKDAYLTVVGSKAFLQQVNGDYGCNTATPKNPLICSIIPQAVAAKDALISAGEIYCAGKDFENGGPCNPPAKGTSGYDQAYQKLSAALVQYKQIESNLRKAIGKQ